MITYDNKIIRARQYWKHQTGNSTLKRLLDYFMIIKLLEQGNTRSIKQEIHP